MSDATVIGNTVNSSPQLIEVLVPGAPGPPGEDNPGASVFVGEEPPPEPEVGWVWVRPIV